MNDPEARAQQQMQAIASAVRDYKVDRWLAGSALKSDRPTLAGLRAAGYDVVRVSETPA
jgi:hypothetical protein